MKKRTSELFWIPFWVDKWIFGSMRIECTLEERAIWIDLLALAAKDNGYIRANENIPYPLQQLAGMLLIPEGVLEKAIDKFVELKDENDEGKLTRLESGVLYITKWEDYQLSDRYKRSFKQDSSAKTEHTAKKAEAIPILKENKIKEDNIKNIKGDEQQKAWEQTFEDLWKNYHPDGKRNEKYAKKRFMALCKKGLLDDFIAGYKGYAQYLKHKRVNENFEQKPKYFSTLCTDYPEYIGFKYKPRL